MEGGTDGYMEGSIDGQKNGWTENTQYKCNKYIINTKEINDRQTDGQTTNGKYLIYM